MIKNKGTKKEAGKKPLELYIHIPFCIRKCAYCDFLSAPAAPEVQEAYVGQLLQEIAASKKLPEDYEAVTVFFGGGTPGILKGELLCSILRALRDRFSVREDAEITVEANPGTVNRDKLVQYREAGVNRISLGLQSADNQELKLLGRIHTWEQFLESFQLARETGFRNINVDLMSALPGQTTESVHRTLERVLALSPEHISAYSLILEEGTPLYVNQKSYAFPTEDEDREMYEFTGKYLAEEGYQRYEISNYAKDGFACRHNCVYWRRGDYVGFGLGASSMVENVRWKNPEKHAAYAVYVDHPEKWKGSQALTTEEQMEEFMFLGLRLTEGIDTGAFQRMFGKTVEEVYGKSIAEYEARGLLARTGERLSLTPHGIDVSNVIFAEFLL